MPLPPEVSIKRDPLCDQFLLVTAIERVKQPCLPVVPIEVSGAVRSPECLSNSARCFTEEKCAGSSADLSQRAHQSYQPSILPGPSSHTMQW